MITYAVASSIEDALDLKSRLGAAARWVAGGTALQLEWTATGTQSPSHSPDGAVLIDISRIDRGPPAAIRDSSLRLAATASLESIRRAAAVAGRLPVLADAIGSVAALGVRHMATMGGNLAWGAGDLLPLLLALDARLVTADGRVVPAASRVEKPRDGSLIVAVDVPLPMGPVVFEKVGRRAAFSPSLVTVAAVAGADGLRCAIGGGPVPPQVAHIAHPADVGALASRFTAPDDPFATGAHRIDVALRVLAGHLAVQGCAA
jgi:CO/xanthine dehydrogenase FAD-binding subunit